MSGPSPRAAGIDRKTVRRYVTGGDGARARSSGPQDQLTDELLGQLVERVRPHRPDGHGEAWRTLLAQEAADQGLGRRQA